jgi:alanyl-tRNA synthetase
LSKSDKQYCYIGILKTNRLSYFACCDIEFANKNKFSCNDLIKQINNLISGSGGGKPTAAQGGTTNIELTNKVVEFVKYL